MSERYREERDEHEGCDEHRYDLNSRGSSVSWRICAISAA
jgi:hypothetical protein